MINVTVAKYLVLTSLLLCFAEPMPNSNEDTSDLSSQSGPVPALPPLDMTALTSSTPSLGAAAAGPSSPSSVQMTSPHISNAVYTEPLAPRTTTNSLV